MAIMNHSSAGTATPDYEAGTLIEQVPKNEDQSEHNGEKEKENLEKYTKAFVKYFKRKIDEHAEEASIHGKGKVGKKTRMVSGLIIILPTMITACLFALPDQTYKMLAAGGAVTVITGFTAWLLKGCKALINISLGRGHRKRAKTIIEKLGADQLLLKNIQGEDQTFLESQAHDIFTKYQNQFKNVDYEFGTIEKLANDAVDRIMNYLTESHTTIDDFVSKGVILGKSKFNWIGRGKTVKFDNAKCNTGDFYSDPSPLGIKRTELGCQNDIILNNCRKCTPSKYGWRYLFPWEMTIINNMTDTE